jgi:hypothetical protein
MTFLKRFFPSRAMKPIVYRGGVVTFRIPAHWQEEYSDIEGGTFYEDRFDSGTLRLKVITMIAPKHLQPCSATDVLHVVANGMRSKGVEGRTSGLNDGNAVFKYEDVTSEEGARISIFNWIVAKPLPPNRARVATFSYTVLAEQRNKSQIRKNLKMLEVEIEAATFSPELGVVSESPPIRK